MAGLYNDCKYLLTTPSHLNFTEGEGQRGRELLSQLDNPPGSTRVRIHNRDSAHLDKTLGYLQQWSHHDHWDFSIHCMVSAAEELA